MLSITIGVAGRLLGHPFASSIEIAEIFHFFIIIFAFAYTQTKKEHVSIGLLVDRFPQRIQKVFDKLTNLIGASICLIFAYVFFTAGIENLLVSYKSTMILEFPLFLLKFGAALGFLMWGLIMLIQMFVPWMAEREQVVTDDV
jgi:TRAP-type C4-dicarboxylate transport system permease small subunit